MALRRLLTSCLLTAFALAGCAEGGDPDAGGAAAAGEGLPVVAADASPDGDGPAAGVALASTPFSKDGTTWAGGCVYTIAATQCTPTPGDAWLIVEAEGDIQVLRGTLRWTPQADYALTLYLLTQDEGAWRWSEGHPMASASTGVLEFDWDVAEYGDEEVLLSVNAYTGTGVGVAAAGASVPFGFHLEGTADFLA